MVMMVQADPGVVGGGGGRKLPWILGVPPGVLNSDPI